MGQGCRPLSINKLSFLKTFPIGSSPACPDFSQSPFSSLRKKADANFCQGAGERKNCLARSLLLSYLPVPATTSPLWQQAADISIPSPLSRPCQGWQACWRGQQGPRWPGRRGSGGGWDPPRNRANPGIQRQLGSLVGGGTFCLAEILKTI